MKPIRLALLLLLLCSLVIGVSAQDTRIAESFLLTFVPNIQFAPFYLAADQGYFTEAGYDFTFEHLNEPDVLDLIAVGQASFGIVSGEQVILARARSRPVVYVYEWFQQYPVGVAVPAASDYETMTDLAGQTIGIPGRFGASYSGFTTLLMAADMVETDVTLNEIGFNAPDVICIGAVNATVVYINNEPLQIQHRADQGDCAGWEDGVRVIPVSSAADLVSNGLITSESFMAENPDVVRAVTEALDHGLSETIGNPARAYLVSLNYVENLPITDDFRTVLEAEADEQDLFLAENPTREEIVDSRAALYQRLQEQFDADLLIQFEVLLASIELWDADRLGYSDLESWQSMQDTLIAMGILEDAIDLEAAFTNEFLPDE